MGEMKAKALGGLEGSVQGVFWVKFGKFSELRGQEFWEDGVLGSGLDFDGLRGGFRVDLAAEWRAGEVVVWVRLGTEIGGGLLGVGCSGVDGKEEEEGC